MTTAHTPRRVQRKRSPGWAAPLDPHGRRPVYVGRGSRWGNPWAVVRDGVGFWVLGPDGEVWCETADLDMARTVAASEYERWIYAPEQAELHTAARTDLHGRDLMCWCPLPEPGQPDHCHAAVLLAVAAGATPGPDNGGAA